MKKILLRLIDIILACIVYLSIVLLVFFRRLFGKIKLKTLQNKVVSISKDGIYRIIDCNGSGYFDWDFTRPYADITYVLFTGNEKPFVSQVGKKVIGVNIQAPYEKLKSILPSTAKALQEGYGIIATIKFIKKTSPKVLEVMFPSKLAPRGLILKFLLPIKLITQVRGNIDLIYYFNHFPTFWPFKMNYPILEHFQILWDKLISLYFFRSCDLVIGLNTNNMLSAISNGAHPSKTKLSRIKIELAMFDTEVRTRSEIPEIPDRGKIVSLWSRLSAEKLVFEAIQAFEKVLDLTHEVVNFIVIGDGPEKDRIQNYVASSKHKDKIHLLGQRDRNFIAEIAAYSAAVVVPYGGSSLVEAVMLNRAVVAFDIEWHNELIRDGETGWLADFPDVNQLAEKIYEAISNETEAARRAAAAKLLAKNMFDFNKIDRNEARYFESLFK